jgi:hypothetical protein
VARS